MNAGVHLMKTNLANKHGMLMSANLFHSQNACVHCFVELIVLFVQFVVQHYYP